MLPGGSATRAVLSTSRESNTRVLPACALMHLMIFWSSSRAATDHRLVLGDSRSMAQVSDGSVPLVVTASHRKTIVGALFSITIEKHRRGFSQWQLQSCESNLL